MMAYKHRITSRDTWFLDKHMKDPIAQELFKVGDIIVICAKCKTAHYESTWGMNSNKCCSMGCNHNTKLNYTTFSPIIFQHKTTRSPGFSFIAERLPFGERLKLSIGYPLAYAVTVFFPVIVVALLVYLTQYQTIPVFDVTDQLTITQSKFDDLLEENQIKLTHIIEKPMNHNINFGNMYYKTNSIASSFDNVLPRLAHADIGGNLEATASNIESRIKYAGDKLLQFFIMVSEFLSNLFD